MSPRSVTVDLSDTDLSESEVELLPPLPTGEATNNNGKTRSLDTSSKTSVSSHGASPPKHGTSREVEVPDSQRIYAGESVDDFISRLAQGHQTNAKKRSYSSMAVDSQPTEMSPWKPQAEVIDLTGLDSDEDEIEEVKVLPRQVDQKRDLAQQEAGSGYTSILQSNSPPRSYTTIHSTSHSAPALFGNENIKPKQETLTGQPLQQSMKLEVPISDEDSDDDIEILDVKPVRNPQTAYLEIEQEYNSKYGEFQKLKSMLESSRNMPASEEKTRLIQRFTSSFQALKDELSALWEKRKAGYEVLLQWTAQNQPRFRDQYSAALQSDRNRNLAPILPSGDVTLGGSLATGYTSNIYTQTSQSETVKIQNLLQIIQEEEKEGSAPTPRELTVVLLPHQRVGLSWMQRMEASINKGGILSDDMGLGKTVQAISLMVSRPSTNPDCRTNLVVAPVALLRQWEAEIKSKIEEDCGLNVFIYNQTNRVDSFEQMKRYDVVLVSYGTLASEMKKHYGAALERAGISKKANFIPDVDLDGRTVERPSVFFGSKNAFYRVFLDEAHLIKNKLTQSSKAAALLTAAYRWCLTGTPMQNKVEELYPLLRFLKIAPYNDELRFNKDIALPLRRQERDSEDLNRDKRAFQKLQLLLKATLLRRTKDSKIDGKPILTLPPKTIVNEVVELYPDEQEFYTALETSSAEIAEKMLNSEHRLDYSNILAMLLRLRQACCHNYLVRASRPDDNAMYAKENWKSMYQAAGRFDDSVIRRINSDVESGITCLKCYEVVVSKDLYFLGGCGHAICSDCLPTFFEDNQDNQSEDIVGKRTARCLMCHISTGESAAVDFSTFDAVCNNKMGFEAYKKHTQKRFTVSLNERQRRVDVLRERNGGELEHSKKVDTAIELVERIFEQYPGEKIIIFSQFTFLFDVMQMFLDRRGIQWLRYDGSMNADQRNNCVSRFYSEPEKRLLLISLKAGNVGLTLTCASHVIMMDPFWNPFVEDQATDRAHRIGQNTEVHVYRLLTANSIEDRILKLQQRKRELVENALDEKGMREVSRLGRREMGFLFNINTL